MKKTFPKQSLSKDVYSFLVLTILGSLVILSLYSFSYFDGLVSSPKALKAKEGIAYVSSLQETKPVANDDVNLINLGATYHGFKEAVGFKESRGKYHVVNKFGYLGKYQFGINTLKALGVQDSTLFMSTPELQEQAFYTYLQRNKWILRKDIERSVGKVIGGVQITESGFLLRHTSQELEM